MGKYDDIFKSKERFMKIIYYLKHNITIKNSVLKTKCNVYLENLIELDVLWKFNVFIEIYWTTQCKNSFK